MEFSLRVRDALDRGEAVVAVESTLLTHGLSYPRSLELVLDIERTIRERGAEPAVVAMMDGEIRIGLEREELERLAQAEGRVKLTTADLGAAAVRRLSGGTTAATTAWIAARAGIPVALAGGLGGVHRDVAETWDISGDLTAMGSLPVMMVCGGIKTFLDVGKSLEALETLGVPVWSYGSDRFPGYFVRESAFSALQVRSGEEAAAMASAHWRLGLNTGIVLGVPIPESDAFDGDEMEAVIEAALAGSEGRSGGKGVTPYLIRAIEAHTQGRSAAANRALIVEAAKAAAETAAAFARLRIAG
ncbi:MULTISPECIES: pseudouridine-5'-phosphate glycosidase [Cohnella]|uniref:pseudouridine-5'-phosphate glycosidase n=1 Tax=Cohnella TaxID=329857 RepID=UPI0009BAD6E8|nr:MULTISPECIES: pseudouridine-5'-phosphate glycosidase [Cohnella]MBN2980370.1 pseudouridine-5'-phosphate glycosidase [Cohnella algarum]